MSKRRRQEEEKGSEQKSYKEHWEALRRSRQVGGYLRYVISCWEDNNFEVKRLVDWPGFRSPAQRTNDNALQYLWLQYAKKYPSLSQWRAVIVEVTGQSIHRLTEARAVATIIHGFAATELEWERDLSGYQENIKRALRNTATYFNPQDVANTLWALATLGLCWSEMGRRLSDGLLASVQRQARRFNPQGVANTLWALAKLGLGWFDLESELREQLLASMHRQAPDFNPQGVANTLWALAKLGLGWSDLESKLRERLLASMHHQAPDFNPQDVANTLWALATLGLGWSELGRRLSDGLLASVQRQARRFKPQEVANTLWALAKLGLCWFGLERGLRDGLLASAQRQVRRFKPQEVANTLWALAALGAPLAPDSHLREEVRNMAATVFDSVGLFQLHAAQVLLKLTFNDKLERHIQESEPEPSHISKLERAVLKELKDLPGVKGEFKSNEYDSASKHFIDIAWVDEKGNKTAIEIDGPSHFFDQTGGGPSSAYQRTTATRVRDRLLKETGWQVKVIPFYEWNAALHKRSYLQAELIRASRDESLASHALSPPRVTASRRYRLFDSPGRLQKPAYPDVSDAYPKNS